MRRSGSDKTPGTSGERAIDFGELPTYVGYQVRRAQARLFAELETALKAFELTPGSFGALTLIHANPGITQGALAGAFGVDKSTMSPVVFRLEQRGLVRGTWGVTENNRKARFYELTAAGRRQLAAEKAEWGRMASIIQVLLHDQG